MDSKIQPANGGANVQQAVPFLWVGDILDSVRFYRDGLGFTVKRKWEDAGRLQWCWLEIGGGAIMLQEGDRQRVRGQDAHAAMDLYFICQDAVALWRQVVARGIAAERPRVDNGMWITSVEDPDGLTVYFESPTEAPEDSVFAE